MKDLFRKSTIRYISILLLLIFPAACVPSGSVSVESPPANEYTTASEVAVVVNFTGQASLLHVYQNGVEITSQLTIEEDSSAKASAGGTATGTVSSIQGANTFKAILGVASDSSTIAQVEELPGDGWEVLLTPEAYNQAVEARYYAPIAQKLMAYAEALGYEPTPLLPIELQTDIFRAVITYVQGPAGDACIVVGRWNVYGPGTFGGIWRNGAEPGVIEILNPEGSFAVDCSSDECVVGEIIPHASKSQAAEGDDCTDCRSCYDDCSLKVQAAMAAAMLTDVGCFGCLHAIAAPGGIGLIPGILCTAGCVGLGWQTYIAFTDAEDCLEGCDMCTYVFCGDAW